MLSSVVGFALSYSCGQCAPLVATFWGVFLWKEFKGASAATIVWLLLMVLFYGGAIALIANAN